MLAALQHLDVAWLAPIALLAGALLTLIVPAADRSTARALAAATYAAAAVVLLSTSAPGLLSLAALAVPTLDVLGRVARTPPGRVELAFGMGGAAACLVVIRADLAGAGIQALSLLAFARMYVILRHRAAGRGSAALRGTVGLLVIDSAALVMLAVQDTSASPAPWRSLIILGPVLARMGVVPFDIALRTTRGRTSTAIAGMLWPLERVAALAVWLHVVQSPWFALDAARRPLALLAAASLALSGAASLAEPRLASLATRWTSAQGAASMLVLLFVPTAVSLPLVTASVFATSRVNALAHAIASRFDARAMRELALHVRTPRLWRLWLASSVFTYGFPGAVAWAGSWDALGTSARGDPVVAILAGLGLLAVQGSIVRAWALVTTAPSTLNATTATDLASAPRNRAWLALSLAVAAALAVPVLAGLGVLEAR